MPVCGSHLVSGALLWQPGWQRQVGREDGLKDDLEQQPLPAACLASYVSFVAMPPTPESPFHASPCLVSDAL